METNVKSILGKLFSSQRRVIVIVTNNPGQKKDYGIDTDHHYQGQLPYRKVIMEAKIKDYAPYSIAIRTPIPIEMESATLITEDLTFNKTRDCICADRNAILYFDDFVGDYELDRLARGLKSELMIAVISWVCEQDLYHIEPPSYHCRYAIDEQREWYLHKC